MGPVEAAQQLRGMRRLVVCRGKKSLEWDLTKAPPGAEEIEKHVLGPTGNLRAPTLRFGKTVLVGFGEEVYASLLE